MSYIQGENQSAGMILDDFKTNRVQLLKTWHSKLP